MKRIFRNNCTSCHTPSYTLQHRFDENGWHAIVQAMKSINVYGMYRPNTPPIRCSTSIRRSLPAISRAPAAGPGCFKITAGAPDR